MDYDKPWMRPCIYTDMVPKDSLRAAVPLEGDIDHTTSLPRSAGDRMSVKPAGGRSNDTSPMRYTDHTIVRRMSSAWMTTMRSIPK